VAFWNSAPVGEPPGTTQSWAGFEQRLVPASPLAQHLLTALDGRDWVLAPDYAAGFRMKLLPVFSLINAARSLSAATQCALHQHRLDDARTNLLALLALPGAGQESRYLIDLVGRLACSALAFAPTWQALQSPDWTDAELVELQAAWERRRFLEDTARCLEIERAGGGTWCFDLARRDLRECMRMLGVLGPVSSPPVGRYSTFRDVLSRIVPGMDKIVAGAGQVRGITGVVLWRWIWLPADQLHYSQALQEGIDYARQLADSQSAVATFAQWPRGTNAQGQPVFLIDSLLKARRLDVERIISRTVLPRFSSALNEATRLETLRSMILAAIALKRHQLRHGRLPAGLDVLVPEFLAAVPVDLGDGAPLRYRLGTNESFLLYSVGQNRLDDGGDPRPAAPNRNLTDPWDGRDCVWPQP
jgi:hypothetical protein